VNLGRHPAAGPADADRHRERRMRTARDERLDLLFERQEHHARILLEQRHEGLTEAVRAGPLPVSAELL